MLTKKIKKTIDKYSLFTHDSIIIVALSGGIDSVCLLVALKQLGYNIRAAHFNHMLRENAKSDEAYAKSLCGELNIPLDIKAMDIEKISKEGKISLETAGRQERYKFLSELSQNHNAIIATAHNLNDSVESVLMHLLRGSGPKGLVGIRPKVMLCGAKIVRPLIECERDEIERFSFEYHPRYDESNDSIDYTRNDIRHNIMPLIKDRNGFAPILSAAEVLSCEEDFFENYVAEIYEKYVIGDSVSIEDFNRLHSAIKRRIVIKMLEKHSGRATQSYTLSHIDKVILAAYKNYGGKSVELPGFVIAKVESGTLKIISAKDEDCCE